jgi:hypothetical protein
MDITFSINQYDYEGDIFDKCILLHFDNFIIRLNDLDELDQMIEQLINIKYEIEESH